MARDFLLAIIFAAIVAVVLNLYSDALRPDAVAPEPARVLDASVIPGRYLAPEPRVVDGNPLVLFDTRRTLLLIYNHGSINERDRGSCVPEDNPPRVLRDLAGQELSGLRIALFSYCSHLKVGVEVPEDYHDSDLAVTRRAKDIENLVKSFIDAGLPAGQIFLAGQSQGAWASLFAARRAVVPFNAVIAFAPAFAGRHEERGLTWWKIHNKQVEKLGQAERLDALVFAFEGDSFNRVEDLAFLAEIEGVDFVALSGESIEDIECRSEDPHFTAYRDCFRRTQKTVIVDFLKHRLWQAHVTN